MRVWTGAKKKLFWKDKTVFQDTSARKELSPFQSQRCGEVSRFWLQVGHILVQSLALGVKMGPKGEHKGNQ